MRLVINTAHQRFGGGVQVATSFILECRKHTENEYHVWAGPGVSRSIANENFPSNFTFYHFDFGKINIFKLYGINTTLRKHEQRIKPDCIISTSGPTYFHSKSPQIIGYNLPLYIYPESPYIKQLSAYTLLLMSLKKRLHFYFFKRDAAAYVVQTDDVNERVRKHLGSKQVFTISNTHSAVYNQWNKYPDKLPAKKNATLRLITVSAFYPHKNLEIIPKVVAELNSRSISNIEFVLTLSDTDFERVNGSNREQILNVGPVKQEECPSLYNECDIMFMPTLAECFSASYPEAMIMGKPIITTDLGFSKNICQDAALYYEPGNEIEVADKIEQLLTDSLLWSNLIKKGKERLKSFDSASGRALKYLELCNEFSDKSLTANIVKVASS